MNYLYWLSQIEYVEQSLVGNQLYILSQLLQHGVAVLPGFVLGNNLLGQVLTHSTEFKTLVRELSRDGDNFNFDNYLTLQSVARHSRQIIEASTIPESWQREIYQAARQLNCQHLILQPFFTLHHGEDLSSRGFWRSHTCNLHPDAITLAIKQTWLELFTARNLLYRHRSGINHQAAELAILVRPLKNVDAAGTVEINANLIRIKAVWGLPCSLLQGDVEADEYYLDRHTGYILSYKLGHKNFACRVQDVPVDHPMVDCLQTYLPVTAATDKYVLESSQLITLFSIIQKICQQQPPIKFLVWHLNRSHIDSEPGQFSITQLSTQLPAPLPWPSSETTSVLLSPRDVEPLLTGISAAPGTAIATVVVMDNDNLPELIPADAVLVITSLSPQQIPLIEQFKGIITEVGGKTSHAAIVARELNIPAVVNVSEATQKLTNGTKIFLNGDEGTIYPATAVPKIPLPNLARNHVFSPQQQLIATKLMVNISQRSSITRCLNLPVDGVGLLRSELMLADILQNTAREQWQSASWRQEFQHDLQESLREFVSAFAPRPIFYRSLDLTNSQTANYILGDRGTYSYQSSSSLFALELSALATITAEGYSNLKLILPFVRSVAEFKYCYRQLENIGLTDRESFQVWMMAEVPSVIWLLPEYIRAGVQGIAIGTNDLTQLILGVDREQSQFSSQGLNANHPAVLKAIAELINIAKKHGIDSCVCGQAPVEYPELIAKLINWGISSISVEPEAVLPTYKAIARAERQILLDYFLQ